ncbi:MAG: N-glycosylase/DNA lyase [Candidatus Diapherotrites archaeon]|uniref:8-oxoguanine DNA glycosylase/AP lyase n=1 Tax=Candidatus Iainarchaeum sp. TaxID=3101447 RepID=A0A7J4IT61_9ARCH|nr:MAG: N-glycosylase/DNA lyase [archaeon GW2011_AR10]MBS3059555.1 N-glycosylase/DNA lyase [Candidatus Diapherotrites archaeon]HIH08642.1 N-glycosylase/DNA lyase [Candidatus Diapherotrites archaeon]
MPRNELLQRINFLKQGIVGKDVKARLQEFKEVFNSSNERWFSELCFCLLTANSSAESGIKIQNSLGFKGFSELSERQLSFELRKLGYRFYNRRAEFIVSARNHYQIKDNVLSFGNENEARLWLVENFKGLGFKEASHFLRNVGFKNVAIIDRHVLSVLSENDFLKTKPKTISPKTYMEIEKQLEEICGKTGLSQGELDLYLWYMKTGKVLK